MFVFALLFCKKLRIKAKELKNEECTKKRTKSRFESGGDTKKFGKYKKNKNVNSEKMITG